MASVADWSTTPASNTQVGGISTDGNVTLVNQLDNMLRGLMAEVATSRDDGTINATGARGYLHGLAFSNNAGDATNDFDISLGECSSDASPYWRIALPSGMTKRTDAAWAVGTGNGCWLDGASMPNGTGHVFLMERSDTGVVDIGASASLSPTLPANYDRKRRIFSILRESAALVSIVQTGDIFRRAQANAISGTTPYTSLLTNMLTPAGIQTQPIFRVNGNTAAAGSCFVSADSASVGSANTAIFNAGSGAQMHLYQVVPSIFTTNTSSQIYTAMAGSGTITTFAIVALGWIDTRGRT